MVHFVNLGACIEWSQKKEGIINEGVVRIQLYIWRSSDLNQTLQSFSHFWGSLPLLSLSGPPLCPAPFYFNLFPGRYIKDIEGICRSTWSVWFEYLIWERIYIFLFQEIEGTIMFLSISPKNSSKYIVWNLNMCFPHCDNCLLFQTTVYLLKTYLII